MLLGDKLGGNSHQVHIHGYSMQVLKTGYPIYDTETLIYQSMTPDIRCFDDIDTCNNMSWANSSWTNGNIPDLIRHGAPAKDTVAIPVGG